MSQNPGTATSFSKEKHASLWEMRAFSNVGMNASPLNLRDERCNLNSQTGGTTSGTSTSKHCRQICSPQQPRAPHPPSPLSGRDPYTGHSNWEGFVGDLGVMPITPRTNVHSDFTSFRNQVLHFFSKKIFCLPGKDGTGWNQPQTPLHFDMHNQRKGTGNNPSQQIQQLLSRTSGDLVFILFIWKIAMISCFCFTTFIYVNKLLPIWQSLFRVKARIETQSYSCTVSHSANSSIWICLDRGSSASARIHEQKSLNLSKWLNPTFLPFPLLFHTLCMSDKLSGKYSLFDISLLNVLLVQ